MTTEAEIREAVLSPHYSHSRQGTGCWRDVVWIYHYDPNSPSCFKLAVGGDQSLVNPIIAELRHPGALSPTEPR